MSTFENRMINVVKSMSHMLDDFEPEFGGIEENNIEYGINKLYRELCVESLASHINSEQMRKPEMETTKAIKKWLDAHLVGITPLVDDDEEDDDAKTGVTRLVWTDTGEPVEKGE